MPFAAAYKIAGLMAKEGCDEKAVDIACLVDLSGVGCLQ
jgi:hypothetical protein